MPYDFRHNAYKVALLMIMIAMLTGHAATKETTNSLPAMDTAAPATFETASFGLG